MKFYFSLLIILSLLISFIGCSELNNDISEPSAVNVHKVGFGTPGSENFHTKAFQANGWNLKECSACHGADYGGGITGGSSCLTCHTSAGGPEACNTCHGDFADGSRIAPPTDLLGNIETTFPGVGAHVIHAYDTKIAQVTDCFECHPSAEGDEKYVYSHVGTLPADMQFGAFTNSNGTASYNFDNNTCANTYCHGNFVFNKADSQNQFAYIADQMVGNNYSPVWNVVDGTQAKCGTCHGELAQDGTLVSAVPTGHLPSPITGCVNCHIGIVNSEGAIIDPVKHINGMANVFGN